MWWTLDGEAANRAPQNGESEDSHGGDRSEPAAATSFKSAEEAAFEFDTNPEGKQECGSGRDKKREHGEVGGMFRPDVTPSKNSFPAVKIPSTVRHLRSSGVRAGSRSPRAMTRDDRSSRPCGTDSA